jgi:hypothetical protein
VSDDPNAEAKMPAALAKLVYIENRKVKSWEEGLADPFASSSSFAEGKVVTKKKKHEKWEMEREIRVVCL